jgi:hypothetical protein
MRRYANKAVNSSWRIWKPESMSWANLCTFLSYGQADGESNWANSSWMPQILQAIVTQE